MSSGTRTRPALISWPSVTWRHGVPSPTALSVEARVGSTTTRRDWRADGGRIAGTVTTGKSKVGRTRPSEALTSDRDRAGTRPWTRRMTDGSGSAAKRARRVSRTWRSTNSVFQYWSIRWSWSWLLERRPRVSAGCVAGSATWMIRKSFSSTGTAAWLLYRRYSLPSLRATHSTPAAIA